MSQVRELAEARRWLASSAGRADTWSAVVLGGGYLALAVVYALGGSGLRASDLAVALPLIALYVIAYRTEFELISGSAVPTQPILVGMLLLLPAAIVPLTVLVALQVAGSSALRSGDRRDAVLLRWTTGWHCLGPVSVLLVAGSPAPSLARWPLYVAALAAQFTVDAAVAAIRARALGVALTQLVAPLRLTFTTDTLLAPIGLAIVLAGGRSPETLLILAAPVGLILLLARDRAEQLETAVSLSTAYSTVQAEARVDALTGLGNRRAWEEAMEIATRRLTEGTATTVTVLMADLDGLKHVNDSHGHEAGDQLIMSMAQALRIALPHAAVTARLGGDEFGVLLLHQSGVVEEAGVLATVRAALDRQPGVRGCALSASLGLASSPPESSPQEAVRVADNRAAADKLERRANRS